MKNLIARGIGIAVIAASGASTAILGTGVAHATDNLIGKKYSAAKTYVSNSMSATPVLATVTGGVLNLDDCLVVSWSFSASPNALGESRGQRVLLNVNCNAPVSEPGVPGNSVMTPTGKKYRTANASAEKIAADPTKYGCYKTEKRLTDCKNLCNATGKCDADSL